MHWAHIRSAQCRNTSGWVNRPESASLLSTTPLCLRHWHISHSPSAFGAEIRQQKTMRLEIKSSSATSQLFALTRIKTHAVSSTDEQRGFITQHSRCCFPPSVPQPLVSESCIEHNTKKNQRPDSRPPDCVCVYVLCVWESLTVGPRLSPLSSPSSHWTVNCDSDFFLLLFIVAWQGCGRTKSPALSS